MTSVKGNKGKINCLLSLFIFGFDDVTGRVIDTELLELLSGMFAHGPSVLKIASALWYILFGRNCTISAVVGCIDEL